MKLIIAIIQDEDASEVISHLNEAKFQVTRLSTKGGFLRAGSHPLWKVSLPEILLRSDERLLRSHPRPE